MADMFLGDSPVVSARVVLPRIGVFYAELTVDSETAPTGLQTLRTADGALTLVGTVRDDRTAVYGDRTELLLIGGRDGLSRTVTPREYNDPTIRVLLQDLCNETREVLSDTADSSILSGTVPRWSRVESVAANALGEVVAAAGASWRILNDGTLWIGQEAWESVEIPGEILDERPTNASRSLQVETLFALLAPGTVWDGRRVSLVEHRASAEHATTTAWFEGPGDTTDRLKRGFGALVGTFTRAMRYHALYPATVLHQDDNGLVDLQPDSPLLPALVKVPLRECSPGRAVLINDGARCLVAFEGGFATGPVVIAWANDPGGVSAVLEHAEDTLIQDAPEVLIGIEATRGIARRDDTVDRNTALVTWMSAVEAALGLAGHPITPFAGATIGSISSASNRGKCD